MRELMRELRELVLKPAENRARVSNESCETYFRKPQKSSRELREYMSPPSAGRVGAPACGARTRCTVRANLEMVL